jgi:hypothetical protein
MLRKLIYLSFVFGLTACGGGMSDMETCSKNAALYMVDQFADATTPEKVKEVKKEIMSISWEEMQKDKEWKMYIGMCEKMKAEKPDQFKKAVKGDFK